MTALSWQPPPVTKCGECVFSDTSRRECLVIEDAPQILKTVRFLENKKTLSKSCPMWQHQNKDKNDNTGRT